MLHILKVKYLYGYWILFLPIYLSTAKNQSSMNFILVQNLLFFIFVKLRYSIFYSKLGFVDFYTYMSLPH